MNKTTMYRTKKVSLQTKLIRLFLMASAIPILFISFFSYYNISNTLKKNTADLTINNLEQTSNSLDIWLESYEDSLYQIYTDDEVVSLVDKLNANRDVSVSTNQLRRFLKEILYTKEYIRSITIITSGGKRINYDQMSAVSNDKSWIENFSLSENDLFDKVSSDNITHIFPTEYGVSFANKDYFLFHIAHRIIDYKNISKINGIVIVSIDEELLKAVCLSKNISNNNMDSFNFIVDENGRIISYINQEKMGNKVTDAKSPLKVRKEAYFNFIEKEMKLKKKDISVYVYHNEDLSWDIINVTNQWAAIYKLSLQQKIVIFVSAISLFVAISLTVWLSRRLVSSVKKVVATMHVVSSGNLVTRVEIEKKMPIEIEFIALQFNEMLGKLDGAMKKEKQAGERQLEAEIKALEAQINPHFLYNTLDTINWMAIDKEDFDISNAINSLANILRYAITNSNAMVEVRQEMEWLKNYIYLQQMRLKNTFRYEVDADPEILNCKIHKLILQPFIENAIIHGFEGLAREHILKIKLEPQNDFIRILVKDNGKGIEPALIDEFNKKAFSSLERGSHIGMENVISRLYMYYGDEANIKVCSILGQETEVIILIPRRV
jgi:two-component system, sensor histidine kinase YesM